MPPVRLTAAFTVLALLAFVLSTVDADARRGRGGHGDHDDAMRYFESGQTLTVEQIVSAATRATGGGDVIEIEFETREGGPACEVKIIDPQGRLRTVAVDARTGNILSRDGGRRRRRGRDDDRDEGRDDD
jgi:uncharacterized membrane protein YkoI